MRRQVRPSVEARCACGVHIGWYLTDLGVRLPFDAGLILITEDPQEQGWVIVHRTMPGDQRIPVLIPRSHALPAEMAGILKVARLHDCEHQAAEAIAARALEDR